MSTLFNVDQFKSALTDGGARPNQFQVELGFPTIIGNEDDSVRKGTFLVTSAALPGQTIPPIEVFYRGRAAKFAGDRIFAPWTATILNDGNLTIRNSIERWMAAIESLTSKTGVTIPTLYQTNMVIKQLNRSGAILRQYRLVGAFPTELSDIGLDFGANDQISTFTCTWAYQHFEIDSSFRAGGGSTSFDTDFSATGSPV